MPVGSTCVSRTGGTQLLGRQSDALFGTVVAFRRICEDRAPGHHDHRLGLLSLSSDFFRDQ